jgi:hypothetical protein
VLALIVLPVSTEGEGEVEVAELGVVPVAVRSVPTTRDSIDILFLHQLHHADLGLEIEGEAFLKRRFVTVD